MLKSITTVPDVLGHENGTGKKRPPRPPYKKRTHSISPAAMRQSPAFGRKAPERRCQSLSPSLEPLKRSLVDSLSYNRTNVQGPGALNSTVSYTKTENVKSNENEEKENKEPVLPQSVITKILRNLATKKRELSKLRKNVITQQNALLEQLAVVKELETKAGVAGDETSSDIRVVSLSGWPAHDLLTLVRDDLQMPLNSDIGGIFGPQVLQQLHAQLNPIPEDVLGMGAEIMARRIDLLNLFRGKHRANLEWKAKNQEFDQETEQLHRMVAGTIENLKAKIAYSMDLSKIPWLDREALVKKIERVQKENMALNHKLEELTKKEQEECQNKVPQDEETIKDIRTLTEELTKEKAAREALKEVVSSAESMLRVARSRIATLERQLKETKQELDGAKRKQKDLEQLYRHRETSYDARSKKLLEVSKTGEMTIDALSRQRDALEIRVKELREQAEAAEREAELREARARSRVESLQAKVAEQEKCKKTAEMRVVELEAKVKEIEDMYQALKERSVKLLDTERRRCLEYIPSKENEPSDQETEIWKELQVMRVALSRAEEELRQSRADKDAFLNSLSRIAQGDDAENSKDKIAVELLDREQKILKLQNVIEELKENEKLMEESMTQYENQLAALRLEVKRLRNYDCYSKEIPYQELQTELLDLHMQVDTLSRERTALVSAAASRALMLERHERAAELFASMTRARRDIAALLDGRTEPPHMDEAAHAEISRSLSSVCASAADTWTALRVERARVLRLESAVLAQNLQLKREGKVRTQLERRRANLERELLRIQHSVPGSLAETNPSLERFYGTTEENLTTKNPDIRKIA